MRRYVPGRASRLLMLALLLGISYGAGYWSRDAGPGAVLAGVAGSVAVAVDRALVRRCEGCGRKL